MANFGEEWSERSSTLKDAKQHGMKHGEASRRILYGAGKADRKKANDETHDGVAIEDEGTTQE